MSEDCKDLGPVAQAALAKKLFDSMEEGLQGTLDFYERPGVLASMIACVRESRTHLEQANLLSSVVDAYVGQLVYGCLDLYLALHDKLVKTDAFENNQEEFGNGAFIYVPLVTKENPKVKVLVIEDQTRKAIIVLNKDDYGDWSIHMRRFYAPAPSLAQIENLFPHDLPAWLARAEKLANDYYGVDDPTRLSLETYLKGSFVVGDNTGHLGLKSVRHWDVGYIVSVSRKHRNRPEAEDVWYHGLGDLQAMLLNLASATSYLKVRVARKV